MKRVIKACQGFTWIELIITLLILALLGFIAVPAYINYQHRAYFGDIITALDPYKTTISDCYQSLTTLKGCSGGAQHIPANITKKKGPVVSVIVVDGVISVVPVAAKGISESDTYVLSPTVKDKKLVWTASGGAVKNGYADKVKIEP